MVIGQYVEMVDSRIQMDVSVNDLINDYRRCSMISDYIGGYSKYYFIKKDRAENQISTVMYELLTFLLNYSKPDKDVVLELNYDEENIIYIVSGSISEKGKDHMIDLLQLLVKESNTNYFIEMLQNITEQTMINTEFGICMILHDYNAKISGYYDVNSAQIKIQLIIDTKEI